MNILRNAVKELANEEGWAALGPVGSRISNSGPFDHRTYGFKKLSDLFAALPAFELEKHVHAGQSFVSVRVRKSVSKKRSEG